MPSKKIMIFGTFDTLHEGHREMFKQAKQYGDFLIVSIARDRNVMNIKGKEPMHSEAERLENLQKESLVDKCFLGEVDDPFLVIKREKPDMIALGYDQKHQFTDLLPSKLVEYGMKKVEIVRLEAYKPETYKSSKIQAKQAPSS